MNRDAVALQMQTLYNKAKAARGTGNKMSAQGFRSGARRLQRRLRADAIANPPQKDNKASDA